MKDNHLKQLDTLQIGIFYFKFGDMTVFQNALINTKLNIIEEQNHKKESQWPIGDFIYFIHKLNIPFQLQYVRPNNMNDFESEQTYLKEFLPLYMDCMKAGIIRWAYKQENGKQSQTE